jgi:uncharacterized membrane protein YbaN (DUF454 family)
MTERISILRSPKRLLFAALGFVCVGLGFVGVFVPGLPTTIFLIAASFLFTRSFPRLKRWLFELRAFRPFLPYVRGDEPLPRSSRLKALGMMWSGVGLSLVILALGHELRLWVTITIIVAALSGTYMILTFRR